MHRQGITTAPAAPVNHTEITVGQVGEVQLIDASKTRQSGRGNDVHKGAGRGRQSSDPFSCQAFRWAIPPRLFPPSSLSSHLPRLSNKHCTRAATAARLDCRFVRLRSYSIRTLQHYRCCPRHSLEQLGEGPSIEPGTTIEK